MAQKTVLVVEGNPVILSDAMTLLEEAGLSVVGMDNADEAFAYTLQRPNGIAAIFTDAQAAGDMNGKDLAEAVTSAFPEIAILVTARSTVSEADLPRSVRVMGKPWLPLEVLTAMQCAAA